MSDLQYLLISLALILLLLVVLISAWQEWRARRQMRQASAQEVDVLMQSTKREPALAPAETTRHDQAMNTEVMEIDPTCEAVIDIVLGAPVAGAELSDAARALTKSSGKPLRLYAARESGGYASIMQAADNYISLHLAVLLTNRSGPISAIDWSNLWALAQNLAERFDGSIEAPEQAEVLARAAELDAQCAALDTEVAITLQLPQPYAFSAIGAHAAEVGMVKHQNGFAYLAENGVPRFLLHAENPQGDSLRLDLLLDVPNSIPDDHAFSRMLNLGRELAGHFRAEVLDDQGRTFTDASAAQIDQQISQIYDKLEKTGFLAGTARTARVFS